MIRQVKARRPFKSHCKHSHAFHPRNSECAHAVRGTRNKIPVRPFETSPSASTVRGSIAHRPHACNQTSTSDREPRHPAPQTASTDPRPCRASPSDPRAAARASAQPARSSARAVAAISLFSALWAAAARRGLPSRAGLRHQQRIQFRFVKARNMRAPAFLELPSALRTAHGRHRNACRAQRFQIAMNGALRDFELLGEFALGGAAPSPAEASAPTSADQPSSELRFSQHF